MSHEKCDREGGTGRICAHGYLDDLENKPQGSCHSDEGVDTTKWTGS